MYHTKQSNSGIEKQISYITYRWYLKHGTNELICETETHMHGVQTCGGEERRRAWGTDWEFRTRDVNYYRMDKQQHRIV